MSLFDFLKKKEFDKILELETSLLECQSLSKQLQEDVKESLNQLNKTKEENRDLELELEIYRPIKDLAARKNEFDELDEKYKKSLEVYKDLREEINLYETKKEYMDYGIYTPQYNYLWSINYQEKLEEIISEQKKCIDNDMAIKYSTNWHINNSHVKGAAAMKKNAKLILRAFNGECNNLIAKVNWNNVNNFKERINKSFIALNKHGRPWDISIYENYKELKISELLLKHEFELKKKQENDEQREIREEQREEERAKREYEKAQKEAEKEERAFQKALEMARKELGLVSGEEREKLQSQITDLEQQLKEAHERGERAMSMAQQTKRGHVYIISNIGSFGEDIYKIGMTRRLEPLDRVKELGDASVPFLFDLHAMIYSDEAPTLEKELHKAFEDRRVNMLNNRKEFFKVTLQEIEAKIKKLGIKAELFSAAEANEYRETVAIMHRKDSEEPEKRIETEIKERFPNSLFD